MQTTISDFQHGTYSCHGPRPEQPQLPSADMNEEFFSAFWVKVKTLQGKQIHWNW